MIDWDVVEDAVENAKGIAFDTCHKIYVLMDDEQVALMREYEYEEIRTTEDQTPSEMLETLKDWFSKSCALKFIEAVETNHENPNAGFTTLIGQFDQDDCEDCGESGCAGVCNDYEDEDEEEDEDEDEDE
jgi:hypothetical protein